MSDRYVKENTDAVVTGITADLATKEPWDHATATPFTEDLFFEALERQFAEPDGASDAAYVISPEIAAEMWRHARRQLGRLQQVRKGTRVRCIYCHGRMRDLNGICMCDGGFLSRDHAIAYLENDMEVLEK